MANDDGLIEGRMLIGGEFTDSESGHWIETINPATEALIGRVPAGTAADVERAVTAASSAQKAWAALDMQVRADYLGKLGDAIAARTEELARLEAIDTGNTIGKMVADVEKAVERIRLAAGLGLELKGETIPSTAKCLHFTLRTPYGIVGRIIPFNHPFGFAASRLASAIIPGNAIIIKPCETSPLSACVLGEIVNEVLPPGVVNIVTGGPATGDAIVRHPKIKRIAFIGHAATGMAIQRAAAEVAVKHVSLELGGKNPMIICPDADLDAASDAAVRGMNFAWQGQSCGSTSRLMLHEDVYDTVLPRVLGQIGKMRAGDPLDPASSMGPMNSRMQYDKTMEYIDIAKADGATLAAGGKRPEGAAYDKGFWVEPTVFTDVTMDMRIAREEVFGPVLSVLKWRDIDEVIDMANAVDYGLTASIWTRDLDLALRLTRAVEAGYVWVNGTGTHFRNVPHGGFKNSGTGREEGIDELLSYTEVKAVNILAG
ncbi:MAG: aldehyde dehydrogenase family protein [Rhodobacteraceae bacterium]|nr:aldehyde dehydrogenase family protein [Paracoccaceae bacterium]